MKRASNILLKIFSIGTLLCLFAGGISAIGYIIGLIIGGEIATEICAFIYKTYLPWVIKFTSAFTCIGLTGMYLSRQKSLTVSAKDSTNDSDK